VLVLSLLLLDDQRVPVLKGVFGPAVEVLHYLGPFLAAPVIADATQKEGVLLGPPGAFLEVGV
jgi:hypothetical protein